MHWRRKLYEEVVFQARSDYGDCCDGCDLEQLNKFHASQLAALWCRGTWSAKAVLQDLQKAVDLGYDMHMSWCGHVEKRVTSRSEETVQDPDYSAR